MSFDGLIEWDDDEPVIVTGLQHAVESGVVTPEQAARLGLRSDHAVPIDAVDAYLNAHFRPNVAADLLAAAQPLMAIAWDRAYRKGIDDILLGEVNKPSPNPYRATDAV